jgi:dTDP-glucose pyrophosphorylase
LGWFDPTASAFFHWGHDNHQVPLAIQQKHKGVHTHALHGAGIFIHLQTWMMLGDNVNPYTMHG